MGSELLAKLRHHAETHQTVYDMDRVRKALLQDAADAIDRLSIDNATLRARIAQLADECAAWRAENNAAHTCESRGIENPATFPCEGCDRHFERLEARNTAVARTGPIRDEERTRG